MVLVRKSPIYFGPFLVTSQVFHITPLAFAFVNLKPLLPGHVLVSPLRPAARVSDLTPAETSDLFLAVRRVGRMVERVYGASSLTIAIQDGADAGQSVRHVHAHVIPRRKGDMAARGGGNAIYEMMEREGVEADVRRTIREASQRGDKMAGVDNEGRVERGEDEMRTEAEKLAKEMEVDIQEEQERGE